MNTIEAPMCGVDAAFQPNYFDHLLVFPVTHGNYEIKSDDDNVFIQCHEGH